MVNNYSLPLQVLLDPNDTSGFAVSGIGIATYSLFLDTVTWNRYQGSDVYELILARVGSIGFDQVINYPNEVFNILTMDDAIWQAMFVGTWYWTVIAKDTSGNSLSSNFTIYSFEVK